MNLKQAFRERGIRQREIAAALGVSEATVSKWANGHETIPSQLLRPLAELLKVQVETIVPAGKLRTKDAPESRSEVAA